MLVQFEYTLDDVVDVHLRTLKRSAAARAWRWRDLILTSLLSGIFLFALFPGAMTKRLFVGVIGLILGSFLYPIVNDNTVKRRLRKLFQENAGPDSSKLGEEFIAVVPQRDDCFCWSLSQPATRQSRHAATALEDFSQDDYGLTPDILAVNPNGFRVYREQPDA